MVIKDGRRGTTHDYENEFYLGTSQQRNPHTPEVERIFKSDDSGRRKCRKLLRVAPKTVVTE